MHVNFVKCEHNVKFQSAELTDGTKNRTFIPLYGMKNEKIRRVEFGLWTGKSKNSGSWRLCEGICVVRGSYVGADVGIGPYVRTVKTFGKRSGAHGLCPTVVLEAERCRNSAQ